MTIRNDVIPGLSYGVHIVGETRMESSKDPSHELVGKEVVYLIDVPSTPINTLPQDKLQVDYLMALSVEPIEYLNNK